jgi:uncharacterized membrane protein YedE/YeeE
MKLTACFFVLTAVLGWWLGGSLENLVVAFLILIAISAVVLVWLLGKDAWLNGGNYSGDADDDIEFDLRRTYFIGRIHK